MELERAAAGRIRMAAVGKLPRKFRDTHVADSPTQSRRIHSWWAVYAPGRHLQPLLQHRKHITRFQYRPDPASGILPCFIDVYDDFYLKFVGKKRKFFGNEFRVFKMGYFHRRPDRDIQNEVVSPRRNFFAMTDTMILS